MSLAHNIRTLRRSAGLAQEQLAEQLGVSRQAVSKWESGRSIPDAERLLALAQAFSVSMEALMTEELGPAQATDASVATQPQTAPTGTLADAPTPPRRRPRRRLTAGKLLCAVAAAALLLWGATLLGQPGAAAQLDASSMVAVNGRGFLLLFGILALLGGLALCLSHRKK